MYRGSSAITGATGEAYTLNGSDLGRDITVRATGVLAGYKNATSTSNAITGVTGDAPAVLSPPSVTGVPRLDETLTVAPGSWTDGPTLSYQWFRDGTAISGSAAKSTTYKVVAADVGRAVHVVETATLSGRTPGTSASAAVTPAPGAAPVATAAPTITPNRAKVGDTVSVSNGTWSPSASYSYQWYRDDVAIASATTRTYRLVADDTDRAIHAVVTASITGRTNGVAASEPIVPNGAVVALDAPSIKGSVIAGRTVTADPGSWSSPNLPTFRYQWFVNGTSVSSSSTSPSYTIKSADLGRRLHVVVTATATGYLPGTASSPATTITGEGRLVAVKAPTITGAATPGSTLTANPGTWPARADFDYQWYRNGVRISGADRSTYSVGAADAARRLHVVVTASATNWVSGSASSAARTVGRLASTTSLTLSTTKTTTKKPVTASVRVSVSGLSRPGGTVTFYDGARKLKTVALSSSGSAGYKLPKLKKGKHTIKAVYSGSTQVAGSQRTASVTVTKAKKKR